jgi:hypothetical protein
MGIGDIDLEASCGCNVRKRLVQSFGEVTAYWLMAAARSSG